MIVFAEILDILLATCSFMFWEQIKTHLGLWEGI